MEKKDMKETLYMLGLDKDTKKVVLDTYLLRKYMFEKELDSFLSENKDEINASEFRRRGFSDIVDEIPVFRGHDFDVKNVPKIADNCVISKSKIQNRLMLLRIYNTIGNWFDKYQFMYENWDVAVKEQERLNSQLKSYYELISAVREKFCDNDILEIIEDFSFK